MIGAIVDDSPADPVEVGRRQRGWHHLFEARVPGSDRHDRPRAGDDPQQPVALDDLERVDADRTIGSDGFDAFLVRAPWSPRPGTTHHGHERACVRRSAPAPCRSPGPAPDRPQRSSACAQAGRGALNVRRMTPTSVMIISHGDSVVSFTGDARCRPASSSAAGAGNRP